MASYFSSWIPQSVQKRLLRYVIINWVPWVDSTTLDLEQLDFKIGTQTTLKFNDVRLDCSKLHTLLKLPSAITIISATVSNLTMNVPADLFRNRIEVTVEGINGRAVLSPPTRQPSDHDKKGGGKEKKNKIGEMSDGLLYSPEEVAAQFVKSQPKKEKRKLERSAVDYGTASGFWKDSIANPSQMESSNDECSEDEETSLWSPNENKIEGDRIRSASDSSRNANDKFEVEDAETWEDEASDSELGRGATVSLPEFLASFLRGIGDKLQIQIRDVKVSVNIPKIDLISQPFTAGGHPTEHHRDEEEEYITLEFSMESLDIQGVTPLTSVAEAAMNNAGSGQIKQGKRRILLSRLCACLLGDEASFDDQKHSTIQTAKVSGPNDVNAMEESISIHGSIRTVKETQNSVDTLKGYPNTSTKIFQHRESTSDCSSDDASYSRPDSEVAEEEKLSRSVACFGSDTSSDAAEHPLGGSQAFADHEGEQGVLSFPDCVGSRRIDVNLDMLPEFVESTQEKKERSLPPPRPNCQHQSLTTLPTTTNVIMEDVSKSSPALLTISHQSPYPKKTTDDSLCTAATESDYSSDASSTTSADEAAQKQLSESMVFSREQVESLYYSLASRMQGEETERSFRKSTIYQSRLDGTSERREDEVSAEEIEERLGRLVDTGGFRTEHQSGHGLSGAEIPNVHSHTPFVGARRLKKTVAELDYVEIWVPALNRSKVSDGSSTLAKTHSAQDDLPKQTVERSHQRLPGSFSMYAASRLGPIESSSDSVSSKSHKKAHVASNWEKDKPSTPKNDGVKCAGESESPSSKVEDNEKPPSIFEAPEVEIIIGTLQAKVDMVVSTILMKLFGILGDVLREDQPSPGDHSGDFTKTNDDKDSLTNDENHKVLEISIGEVICKLVEVLGGTIVENGGSTPGPVVDEQSFPTKDPKTILGLAVQGAKIGINTIIPAASSSLAGQIIVNTRAAITKLAIQDSRDSFIDFIPELPPSLNLSPKSNLRSKKKRTSSFDNSASIQHDIVMNITTAGNKKKIVVETLPLRINCELQRLEDLFDWFGGFGNISGLGSANSVGGISIPTVQGQRKNVKWKDDNHLENHQHQHSAPGNSTSVTGEVKVEAKVGGLLINISGKDGALALRTSVIKVKKTDSTPIVVGIDRIVILGPQLAEQIDTADARICIDTTRIEFSSCPNDDDLARLLRLLTPSNDRFTQEDDIMIPLLLEQRRKGSVLRISVDKVISGVDDVKECKRFLSLSEEIGNVLTVTNYIPQDERPGIMTLLYVGNFELGVEIGMHAGHICSKLSNVELLHVTAPTLLALAITGVSAKRNGDEDLVGEGLSKAGFSPTKSDGHAEDRPMVMVRMVGDEPEPILKIKVWNLRVEYRVETLMALAGTETGERMAREMVDSIASIATVTQNLQNSHIGDSAKPKRLAQQKDISAEKKSLVIDITIRDSVLSLNPSGLPSQALAVLTDSQVILELPLNTGLHARMDLRKGSVFLIDDVSLAMSPQEAKSQYQRRKGSLSDNLAGFAAVGYVPVATISSAKAVAHLVESDVVGQKCLEAEVCDVFFLMETCADSTQTLLSVVNGLKPPMREGEQVKYRTEVMPVEMFQSICEDAFVHPSKREHTVETSMLVPLKEPDDIDVAVEHTPISLAFEESYYAHGNANYSGENLADSVLIGDLTTARSTMPFDTGDKGILATFTEQVHLLDDAPIEIMEDHFPRPSKEDLSLIAMAAKQARGAPFKVRLRDVHFIWNLHDGYDWSKTRDTLSKAVKRMEFKASERHRNRMERRTSLDVEDDDESVIDDFLFNSIYIGIPANRDPRELSRQINRALDADNMSETSYASTSFESRPSSRSRASTDPSKRKLKFNRSRSHKVQFELKGVSADVVIYQPDSGETQSSVDLRVKDLEIIDNVPTSTWKKFVTYMQDAGKRETGSNMVHIEVLNVKPVPDLAATELVIRATILPLRLHVDQDTLDFMTRFFAFKDDSVAVAPAGEEPFIQRIEVNSVRVKLDYKPKKVDYVGLRSGHTTEFMNFFILEEADMVMKHVILHGISGFARMGQELNDIWMPDIRSTQLPDVLSGVAPVRSLVNIGSGVKNLVAVPIREYKKDGRIVRSLQKGAVKFAKTTASEVVKLGAKLAVGTQGWLETTEELLGGQGSAGRSEGAGAVQGNDDEEDAPKVISLYADQPKNVLQGLRGASVSLKRNLNTARDAMRSVPEDISQRGSATGVAQAVARAAPIMVLRPMIGATEAISKTLLGVTNSIDPENKRRVDDKYKKH